MSIVIRMDVVLVVSFAVGGGTGVLGAVAGGWAVPVGTDVAVW